MGRKRKRKQTSEKSKGNRKEKGWERKRLKVNKIRKLCGKGEEEEESGGGHRGSVRVEKLIERVITSKAFQIGYSVR